MSDPWLAFFGAILCVFISVLITSIVQRQNEAKKKKEQARHDIYMRLLQISQMYFFIASADMRGEKADENIVMSVRDACWKLADKLRACDSVESLDLILEFLFSTKIPSSSERANLLNVILDKYSSLVNPEYQKYVRKISDENIVLYAAGKDLSKAPTALLQ